MKRKIFVAILTIGILGIFLQPAHAVELLILGKHPSELTAGDVGKMAFGAVAALGVHGLGHIAVMEAYDVDYKIESLTSFTFEDTRHENLIIAAGFATETAVGILLNIIYPDKPFTFGYTAMSTIHPFLSEKDFETISNATRPLFAIPGAIGMCKMIEIRW